MSVVKLFFISPNYARLKLIVNVLKKQCTREPFFIHFICLTDIITVIGIFSVRFFRSLVTNILFHVDLLCLLLQLEICGTSPGPESRD